MRRLRQRKLQDLVNALFDEAGRLGYSVDELMQAVDDRRRRGR